MEKTREVLFTETEFKALQALAQKRGFTSVRSYIRSLIEQDATQHSETAPVMDDGNDGELGDPIENFREAWTQAQRGELLTEEEFWKAVADDD